MTVRQGGLQPVSSLTNAKAEQRASTAVARVDHLPHISVNSHYWLRIWWHGRSVFGRGASEVIGLFTARFADARAPDGDHRREPPVPGGLTYGRSNRQFAGLESGKTFPGWGQGCAARPLTECLEGERTIDNRTKTAEKLRIRRSSCNLITRMAKPTRYWRR
jgi:hypothetical protein